MDTDSKLYRLKEAVSYAFQKPAPGEEAPPVPHELRDWAQHTCVAMMAGILFGGGREYLEVRKLGAYRPSEAGLSKAHLARAIAEENTQRMLRVSRKSIRACFQFGALAGLFYGVQKLSAVANAEKSLGDTVLAAGVTGSTAGMFLPGPAAMKVRSTVSGGLFGALVGFPIAYAQSQIDARLYERHPELRPVQQLEPEQRYPIYSGNPAEGVIRRLETSYRKD